MLRKRATMFPVVTSRYAVIQTWIASDSGQVCFFQSWTLSVFFNFFNNYIFFPIFYQGIIFLHQSYLKNPLPVKSTRQKMQQIIFFYCKKLKNTPQVRPRVHRGIVGRHGRGRVCPLARQRLQRRVKARLRLKEPVLTS